MEADEGSEEGRRKEMRRQAAGRGTGKVKVRKSRLSENVPELCPPVIPQQVQRVLLVFNFNRHTSCTFPPLCGNTDGS